MRKLTATIIMGIFMLSSSVSYAEETVEPVKSQNDRRDYHTLVLPNGFKLMVISDAEAQRAAAAVDIKVGSGNDPEDYPGLAHFLEHMLFLGTDQYPEPDDYIQFISKHGGNHNAYTAFNRTNYFFDIDPDYLQEGLKRFSRFFVAPLMDANYVDRERNAVDSEYQSKLKEDGWRKLDVIKQAVNPKNPYSRFTIGNNETLPSDSVRDALWSFYQTHYYAENMAGVIIGREDIETLTSWGESLFSPIPTKTDLHKKLHEDNPKQVAEESAKTKPSTGASQSESKPLAEQLFSGVTLPLLLQSQSIRDEKWLTIQFALPYELSNDYSKSLQYLSHVIGYEGSGSLLSALKSESLATALYAGAGQRVDDELLYEVGIKLTNEGAERQQVVLAALFAYLDLLRADTTGLTRYKELAKIAETNFTYQEKTDAIHLVSSYATRLNRYDSKDVLTIQSIFTGYEREQIERYLALMTPNNMVLHFTSPQVSSEQKSPYFSVPYTVQSYEVEPLLSEIKGFNKALIHLPKANAFISSDYIVNQGKESAVNEKLASGIEFYYASDSRFNVPKSSLQLSLQPQLALTLKEKNQLKLLAKVIDEQLTEMLYDAAMAGIHAEIQAGETTLNVIMDGYDAKMATLLQAILQTLQTSPIDEAQFLRVKTDYQRELTNALRKRPYEQTFTQQNAVLTTHASLPQARLEHLDDIQLSDIEAFRKRALEKLAIRMLVYGNMTQKQAKSMAESVGSAFSDATLQYDWKKNESVALDASSTVRIEVPHSDHAISYYLQSEKGYEARAIAALAVKMLEADFFTQLRTEKQLGYIVFAYPRPVVDRAGIGFTIQSPVASATALSEHIQSFYQDFVENLGSLTQAEFDSYKQLLQKELRQQPENLQSAAMAYWRDIITTNQTTNSQEAVADALDTISLSDFIEEVAALFENEKNRLIILAEPKDPDATEG